MDDCRKSESGNPNKTKRSRGGGSASKEEWEEEEEGEEGKETGSELSPPPSPDKVRVAGKEKEEGQDKEGGVMSQRAVTVGKRFYHTDLSPCLHLVHCGSLLFGVPH